MVDTNVPIVANRQGGEPIACAAACAKALNHIKESGILVIDQGNRIFNEYKNNLSFAGQPGAGNAFFKWLADNRYRPDRVSLVALEDDPVRLGEYTVFPDDPSLNGFDPSDRKFVAVALTHPARPPILNATDSDWWNFREELRYHDITIEFVCGEERFKLR